MNVVLCSAFRNSENYLDRYFEQVSTLERLLSLRGDCLSLVLGYGDCTDDTAALLFEHTSGGIGARLIDCSHGGKHYGSVVDAERFKQAAGVCNKIWSQIPADSDVVIWVESDLIWPAEVILALIDDLEHVPCVAPMVMHATNPGLYKGDGEFFYDRFAFVRNGVHFTNEPPFHADLESDDDGYTAGLVQLDSAGSCLVMNAELARHLIWPEEDVIVGVCKNIYRLSGSVWLDSSLSVFHA